MSSSDTKNVKIFGVLSSKIDEVWREVEPLLQKAINFSDGTYDTTDVYESLKNKYMQLWVAYNNKGIQACCVTQILCYPQDKRLGMLFVAGHDFPKWSWFLSTIKSWAKVNGCSCIEGPRCRPGWEKLAKSLGFVKTHIVLKLSLEGDD